MKNADPPFLSEIKSQPALVAVAGKVVGAQGPGERWSPAAGIVTGAGALDLEHVSPKVAQDLPAKRPRQHAGGVEHANAVQGTVRVGRHAVSFRSARADSRT